MAKCIVFNSFLVRQIELIGQSRLFNMPFQPRPTQEAGLASNSELGVAELKLRVKNIGVRSPTEPRMELPNALGRCRIAGGMFLQQIFRLILEMIEIGMGWET